MKTVALISGGKDSCYNMMQCVAEGHEIVALANLRPKHKDELDSYMFQTVGYHAIELYSEAIGLPLYQRCIQGSSVEQGKDYVVTEGDEVEDLYELLKTVKMEQSVEAVAVGAILSNYQRVRVESVCTRLGLTALAYLWQRDQKELLDEMINCGVTAILIKVATLGLTEKHLGQTLSQIQQHMLKMEEKYQINVCGEGGEYETLTLDCPLFNKKIVIDKQESVIHSDEAFASVHYLHFHQMHLQEKDIDTSVPMFDRVKELPMKIGSNIHKELQLSALNRSDEDEKTASKHILPILEFQPSSHNVALTRCKSRNGFLKICGISSRKPYENNPSAIKNLTEGAIKQLQDELARYKMKCEDVVLINLYVCSMTYYRDINSVFPHFFPLNPPARVCVQVDFFSHYLFEMDCLAHRYAVADELQLTSRHNTMHVQGISHWAPANIGPYSQAVEVDAMVFCAGVIGLCPSSMTLIEGGVLPECRLSLQSVDRILCSMTLATSIRNAILSVCYVTSSSYIRTAREEWKAFHNRKMEKAHAEDLAPPCLLAFIVVPSLPRNAAVEWHVTAHVNRDHWQYLQEVNDICGIYFSSECLFSADDGVATLLISADCCRQKVCLTVLLQNLVTFFCNCVTKVGFERDQTLYMQLFFHQEVLEPEQLKSAMAEVVDFLGQPCISFVPVKGLETSDRLLTIYAWLHK